jgi:predicted GH43/DUF377 family glycosyl hydrolase
MLVRYKFNPVLKPISKNWWESKAVFNPAALYTEGRIHLLYRAIGEYDYYISRIGYAISEDGYVFRRVSTNPVFQPDREYDKWGCEDPRITKIEGEVYMTYVALKKPARQGGGPPRTALAKTRDFKKFHKIGVITPPGADDRDVVLFPEKIDGSYVMLHRPHNWIGKEYGTAKPSIWIAYSKNLRDWKNHKLLLKPEEKWEEFKVGAGSPPIKTEEGWLLIYHGVDNKKVYRAGIALLDSRNPSIVISRTKKPVLEPREEYEKHGDVQNVVFPEAAVVIDGRLLVYYGAADKYVCVAEADISELLSQLLHQ